MSLELPFFILAKNAMRRAVWTVFWLFAMFQPALLPSQEKEKAVNEESGDHLVLPEWSKEDQRLYNVKKKRFPSLGGGLWPPELYPLPSFEQPLKSLAAFQADDGQDTNSLPEIAQLASQARQGKGDMASQLKFPVLSLAACAPASVPEELAQAQMDLYFGQKPAELLIDPPRLLTETQKDDVVRLLTRHDRDSEIPLYLFLLNHNQHLPRDFDLSKLADAWFGSSSGCVLIVHLGAPLDSQLMFTAALRNQIGPRDRDAWLQECITSAQIASEPIDQVERFVAQNSLRIFWLEKMLHPLPVTHADEKKVRPPLTTAFLPAPIFLVDDQAARKTTLHQFPMVSITGLGLLLAGCMLGVRRSRQSKDAGPSFAYEVNAYLEAPHCGGHGASIHF